MPFIVHNTENRTFNAEEDRYLASLATHDDLQHSYVLSGNCYERFHEEKRVPLTRKSTADKVIVGYSSEGLPFQIIVNGSGPQDITGEFFEGHVAPLIEHYIRELKKVPHKSTATNFDHSSAPNDVTKKLIHELYDLKQKYAADATFSMSIAVNYTVGAETFCTGFGIGDTSLIMKRVGGSIEQLVAHTNVKEETELASSPDTFGKNPKKINAVIERNPVFSTACKPGDELVGYTFAYMAQQKKAVKNTLTNGTITYSYPLNTESLETQGTFFDAVTSSFRNKHQSIIDAGRNVRDEPGDDVSFAGTKVPDAGARLQIQEVQYNYLLQTVQKVVGQLQEGSKLKEKANIVLNTLTADTHGFSLAAKNEALSETLYVLTTPNKVEGYRKFANEVKGRPSRACKILGGFMLALAVVAAATVVTLVSISTFGVGSAPAIALMAVGGASLLSSLGLFGCARRNGLSKTMVKLADSVAVASKVSVVPS